jgi:hydrogenase nickel incorporation protein HypA/HybF
MWPLDTGDNVHGLSIASGIVETVLKSLESYDVKKVLRIDMAAGELMGLSPEELKYGFEIASGGTILEGVGLNVQIKPAEIKCLGCDYKGRPKSSISRHEHEHISLPSPQCPKCEGFAVEVLEGKTLTVTNLKVELK